MPYSGVNFIMIFFMHISESVLSFKYNIKQRKIFSAASVAIQNMFYIAIDLRMIYVKK
jgi:hypothetical protein